MRDPNTTFDFYRSPNAPPSLPDGSGRGYLLPVWRSGNEANEGNRTWFWTDILDVPLATDIRDDWVSAPSSYAVFIPTRAGQKYKIVFVERVRTRNGIHYKRVFLRREPWQVHEDVYSSGGIQLAGDALIFDDLRVMSPCCRSPIPEVLHGVFSLHTGTCVCMNSVDVEFVWTGLEWRWIDSTPGSCSAGHFIDLVCDIIPNTWFLRSSMLFDYDLTLDSCRPFHMTIDFQMADPSVCIDTVRLTLTE